MRTSNVTYLVKKGISSIWKNFLMSFASFCILMVSLLLVSCAVLLMMNVNKIMSNIEDTNEITIYLKEDISDKQVEHIKSVLEKNQDITDVKYYSKEQAMIPAIIWRNTANSSTTSTRTPCPRHSSCA